MRSGPTAITLSTPPRQTTYPLPSLALCFQLLPGVAPELALCRVMSMAHELAELGIELREAVMDLPSLAS